MENIRQIERHKKVQKKGRGHAANTRKNALFHTREKRGSLKLLVLWLKLEWIMHLLMVSLIVFGFLVKKEMKKKS